MSTTPPRIQTFAQKILAVESESGDLVRGKEGQSVPACEKLRAPLVRLAGTAGFSSMLSRALSLAKRQVPSLASLHVEADGRFGRKKETQAEIQTKDEFLKGEAVLLAEFLWLLVTLIGEPLTINLVREAWPHITEENLTLVKEVKS